MDRLPGFRIQFGLLHRDTKPWRTQRPGCCHYPRVWTTASSRRKLVTVHSCQIGSSWAELVFKHVWSTLIKKKKLEVRTYTFGLPFSFEKWKLWENRKSGQSGFRCPCSNGANCTSCSLSGVCPLTFWRSHPLVLHPASSSLLSPVACFGTPDGMVREWREFSTSQLHQSARDDIIQKHAWNPVGPPQEELEKWKLLCLDPENLQVVHLLDSNSF